MRLVKTALAQATQRWSLDLRLPDGLPMTAIEVMWQPGAARAGGNRMSLNVRAADGLDWVTPSAGSIANASVFDDGTANFQVSSLDMTAAGAPFNAYDKAVDYTLELIGGNDVTVDHVYAVRILTGL
jgi:hypothetical protein